MNCNYKETLEDQLRQASKISETDTNTFLRDLFPEGYLAKNDLDEGCHGLLICKQNKHTERIKLFDNLETGRDLDDSVYYLSPIAYDQKNRPSQCRALVIDLYYLKSYDDNGNLDVKYIERVFEIIKAKTFPCPTYIVNSGIGYHLYFVFDEPVPLYPKVRKELAVAKEHLLKLAYKLIGRRQSVHSKQDGIYQQYVLPGSKCKYGGLYNTYKTGKQISIDYLNSFLPKTALIKSVYYTQHTLEDAKKLYPSWYRNRIELGRENKSGQNFFICNRSLFDWWCKTVEKGWKVGFCAGVLFCTAVYASKAGIDWTVAESALKQQELMMSEYIDQPIDWVALESVVKDGHYRTMTIEKLSEISGMIIEKNKRNGRTQEEHLKLLAASRAQNLAVYEWRLAHPVGTKTQCKEDLGLSYKTVRKWWDCKSGEAVTKTSSKKHKAKVKKETCISCRRYLPLIKNRSEEITDSAVLKKTITTCPACGFMTAKTFALPIKKPKPSDW